MPYINSENRDKLTPKFDLYAQNSGDLNYQLTMVILDYIKHNGKQYKQINDVIGALEGCKLEFYRRFAVPYENTKIESNGDVYDK